MWFRQDTNSHKHTTAHHCLLSGYNSTISDIYIYLFISSNVLNFIRILFHLVWFCVCVCLSVSTMYRLRVRFHHVAKWFSWQLIRAPNLILKFLISLPLSFLFCWFERSQMLFIAITTYQQIQCLLSHTRFLIARGYHW